ncbi:wax ester/triacylglycerol synthase domain-containing protein [Streptomyces sp. NPDC048282]|uniref:wax ester/triacylglycerol synthase domain-containing protein n=1 Tax=Streptomyces sp. NPDC048282 TaxID=3365528 RepID=UPI00371BCF97
MSGTQLPFMEEGMARWPFGPPNAGIALDFTGSPLQLGEVRTLVRERWAGLPRLERQLVRGERRVRSGWSRRHRWEARTGHDPAAQVRDAGADTLRDAVDDWFHSPFPGDEPPWNLHLLRGPSAGESTLLFRMHHSLLDGRSLTTLLRALLDGCAPVDAGASTAGPGELRRTPVPGTQPGLLATGLAVPLPGKGERRMGYAVVRLPPDLLRTVRERSGATTNTVFLAAVSGVLRSCLLTSGAGADVDTGVDTGAGSAAGRVWLSVPVDQRPADRGDFLGNAFCNVRLPAPVDVSDPAARLRACAGLLTTVTRPPGRAEKLLEAAVTALPGPAQALARGRLFAPAYAPAACTYVHLRETGRTLAGRPLRRVTLIPMVPPDDTVTFALGGCGRGHTVSVCTNSGAEDADLLAESFRHELALLAETAPV